MGCSQMSAHVPTIGCDPVRLVQRWQPANPNRDGIPDRCPARPSPTTSCHATESHGAFPARSSVCLLSQNYSRCEYVQSRLDRRSKNTGAKHAHAGDQTSSSGWGKEAHHPSEGLILVNTPDQSEFQREYEPQSVWGFANDTST